VERIEAFQWSILDIFWLVCQGLGFFFIATLIVYMVAEVIIALIRRGRNEWIERQGFKRLQFITDLYEATGPIDAAGRAPFKNEPNRWTRDFVNTVCAEQGTENLLVIRQLAGEMFCFAGDQDPVSVAKNLTFDWSRVPNPPVEDEKKTEDV
jgi:hypothetical protein